MVNFLFALELAILNAGGGAGAGVPQATAVFVAGDNGACAAWLKRLRPTAVSAAAALDMPAFVVYHGSLYLEAVEESASAAAAPAGPVAAAKEREKTRGGRGKSKKQHMIALEELAPPRKVLQRTQGVEGASPAAALLAAAGDASADAPADPDANAIDEVVEQVAAALQQLRAADEVDAVRAALCKAGGTAASGTHWLDAVRLQSAGRHEEALTLLRMNELSSLEAVPGLRAESYAALGDWSGLQDLLEVRE